MSGTTEITAEMIVSERTGVYYDTMCGEFAKFEAEDGVIIEKNAVESGEIHRMSPEEFFSNEDEFFEVSSEVVNDPVSFFEEIVSQLASRGECHLGGQDIDFMYARRVTSVSER